MKMKAVLLVSCLFLIAGAQAHADQPSPIKKPKAVRVDFTGKQARRRLTRTELIEKAAYIRHLKRLRAEYDQPMPDFR